MHTGRYQRKLTIKRNKPWSLERKKNARFHPSSSSSSHHPRPLTQKPKSKLVIYPIYRHSPPHSLTPPKGEENVHLSTGGKLPIRDIINLQGRCDFTAWQRIAVETLEQWSWLALFCFFDGEEKKKKRKRSRVRNVKVGSPRLDAAW